MDIAMLILRVVVGLLFVGHGTQKLFGWFGGGGVDGTSGFLGSLGFRSRGWVAVAGLSEAGGGLLLAAGFLTPLAAAAIVGMMVTATVLVHWDKGVWNTAGGYELPLVMATSATAVAFAGPGSYSVDALLGWTMYGTAWGLGAIALGGLAAIGSLLARRTSVESETKRADEPADAARAA